MDGASGPSTSSTRTPRRASSRCATASTVSFPASALAWEISSIRRAHSGDGIRTATTTSAGSCSWWKWRSRAGRRFVTSTRAPAKWSWCRTGTTWRTSSGRPPGSPCSGTGFSASGRSGGARASRFRTTGNSGSSGSGGPPGTTLLPLRTPIGRVAGGARMTPPPEDVPFTVAADFDLGVAPSWLRACGADVTIRRGVVPDILPAVEAGGAA